MFNVEQKLLVRQKTVFIDLDNFLHQMLSVVHPRQLKQNIEAEICDRQEFQYIEYFVYIHSR